MPSNSKLVHDIKKLMLIYLERVEEAQGVLNAGDADLFLKKERLLKHAFFNLVNLEKRLEASGLEIRENPELKQLGLRLAQSHLRMETSLQNFCANLKKELHLLSAARKKLVRYRSSVGELPRIHHGV